MANLKAIRRRIGSVQNTQKITRAMKMVAAAKLRRAQDAVTSFRAYADLTQSILAEVSQGTGETVHPLLERRPETRRIVLVLTSDRGLCGPFNSNLLRKVEREVQDAEVKPHLDLIGKKGKAFFQHREVEIRKFHKDIYDELGYDTAKHLAAELSYLYTNGEVDRIDLAYNEFVSVVTQNPVIRPLLPIELSDTEEASDAVESDNAVGPRGFLFEPDRASLLRDLLPKYIEVQIYRALVESVAAEQASRMTAMEAATSAAGDMIDSLTLQYNRARQDAITTELMDIVGGAEALSE